MSIFDSAFSNSVLFRQGVQRTAEFDRIARLPRRALDVEGDFLRDGPIPDLTPLYLEMAEPCAEHPRCPICAAGPPRLWPAQSAALLEAEAGWGLLAPMGVGSGKTLVTLLLADALASERTVLLVPAALRNQLLSRDMAAYGRHFRLPVDRVRVVAYTQLSDARTADVLEQLAPDLIVADEAHSLARASAARTKRFVRFMRSHPGTRFCALSGTMTRRSLKDYAHLAEISLRAGSPVPANWSDLQDWADALDPVDVMRGRVPAAPGALRALAEGDPRLSGSADEQRAAAREGYRRRLVETTGVVATSESWEGASLVVRALYPELPKSVSGALQGLRDTWAIGDEEIESPARLVEVAKQLAAGFYYRWVWPDGVRDVEWLRARAAWHKQVRWVLQHSRAGLDSPLLVTRAAQRGELADDVLEAWRGWDAVRDRYSPQPPVEAVWVDRYVVEEACRWAAREEPAIVWYAHREVGADLGEAGLPVYGPGTDAGEAEPEREPAIACSISSQGTGKNLQRYSKSLVVEPPVAGAAWEQMIGRLHRPGQRADEVIFDVFAQTSELQGALYRAVEDALFVQSTQGQRQKILKAQRVDW